MGNDARHFGMLVRKPVGGPEAIVDLRLRQFDIAAFDADQCSIVSRTRAARLRNWIGPFRNVKTVRRQSLERQ